MAELPKGGSAFWLARYNVENQRMFQRPNSHTKAAPTAPEISEARFKRFLRELETYERKLTFERTLDAFLDLYSSWKKTHETPIKLRLVMLAFELHRLNHQFEFTLSFHDEGSPIASARKHPSHPQPNNP